MRSRLYRSLHILTDFTANRVEMASSASLPAGFKRVYLASTFTYLPAETICTKHFGEWFSLQYFLFQFIFGKISFLSIAARDIERKFQLCKHALGWKF